MLRLHLYLPVFLAVTATAVGITASLAVTVSGGVRRRALHSSLGPDTCTASMGMQAGPTTMRLVGYLLGASGINSVLWLTI